MELTQDNGPNQGKTKTDNVYNESIVSSQQAETPVHVTRDKPTATHSAVSVSLEMTPSSEVNAPLNKDKKNGKEKKPFVKPKDEVTFRTHLTSLAHISVVVFVYVVLKLSFRGDFVFFTWHPILMSLGWMFLMTQGLYAINKYNTYWRFKTTGSFRVKIHWLTLSIGYVLSVIGFVVVYINKDLNNKHHFVSWHAIFGLIGLVSTLPPIINGTVLLYKKELAYIIDRPRLIKFIHVTSGCAAFLFGALALILSVYTRWYGKKSNQSNYIFWVGLISASYPLFWAIYGPSVKLYRVIIQYFTEKED